MAELTYEERQAALSDQYNETKAQIANQQQNAMNELSGMYGGMINEADKFYGAQIQASKDWAETQSNLQNQMTDFAISEINQNKEQSRKDYIKEQSGAYVDWQKQSNKYGSEAERMVASGLTGTGYSESSQVAMYNQYQSRVATARESYNLAVQNYNNAITEARLQNNSALAQIAFEALNTQLELSLQGFQYKNTLLMDQFDKKTAIEDRYWQRELAALEQYNADRQFEYNAEQDRIQNEQWKQSFEEEQRQHDENLAFNREQAEIKNAQWAQEFAESIRQWNASFEEDKRQYDQGYQLEVNKFNESVNQWQQEYNLQSEKFTESIRQFDEEMARLRANDTADNQYRLEQLQLERDKLVEEQRQWDEKMQLEAEQLELQRQELSLYESSLSGDEGGDGDTEKEPEYDEASILKNLGANYTAENIDTMIRQGKVEEYTTEDGKTSFRWTESYNQPQQRPNVDTQAAENKSLAAWKADFAKSFENGKYSESQIDEFIKVGDVELVYKNGLPVYQMTQQAKNVKRDLGKYYSPRERTELVRKGLVTTTETANGPKFAWTTAGKRAKQHDPNL